MPRKSAAVAGIGFIGPVHVEALRRLGIRVKGILGSSPAKSEMAAKTLGLPKAYSSYEELLSDPDVEVIHIATPNRQHRDMVVGALIAKYGVQISSLGYYPNPLCADPTERATYAEHLRRVIEASARLGIGLVTTFIGRDHLKSFEENWKLFELVWKPLISFADDYDVKVGIENCPMMFSDDEWPGGKNLAISPEIWRRMFDSIPSRNFGLNFDPSHLAWQKIDYVRALYEFKDRIVHVHAKDDKTLADRLYDRGILGLGWHIPKLPGFGDVQWNQFFSALTDIEYRGPVCVEVEDRAYEYSLEGRQKALRQSYQFLKQFVV
jgi:sugar phosphate isomerase/epimerase